MTQPLHRMFYLALLPALALLFLFAFVHNRLALETADALPLQAPSTSPPAASTPSQEFIEKSAHAPSPEAFIADFRERVTAARMQLEAVAVAPESCQDIAATINSLCLRASVLGSYGDLKLMLANLQARHERHLVLRGLRMQRRDGANGMVSAEVELALIGGVREAIQPGAASRTAPEAVVPLQR